MAKSKKQVTDFQEALLNNSKFIGKKPAEKKETTTKHIGVEIPIDPDIVFKYKQLGEHHKIDHISLMELALNHFLSLEIVWFNEKIIKE